jgi:hypothetical protein
MLDQISLSSRPMLLKFLLLSLSPVSLYKQARNQLASLLLLSLTPNRPSSWRFHLPAELFPRNPLRQLNRLSFNSIPSRTHSDLCPQLQQQPTLTLLHRSPGLQFWTSPLLQALAASFRTGNTRLVTRTNLLQRRHLFVYNNQGHRLARPDVRWASGLATERKESSERPNLRFRFRVSTSPDAHGLLIVAPRLPALRD